MYIRKLLKGRELIEYKKTLKLTNLQRDIILGTLLGDASMEYRNNKPSYSIKYEQSLKHSIYLNHLYEIFKDYVGMIPVERDNKSIWFRTYRHNSFKYYYDIFYILEEEKLIKIIPKNLKKLLNDRVLAYWYMDDGSYNKSRNQYYLHTQGFTYEENFKLVEILKERFDLNTSIHKDRDKYKIYIKSISNELFISIIKPYIIEDMNYKLI